MSEANAPMVMSGIYFDLHVDYKSRQISLHGGVDVACAPNVATAIARLQRRPGDIIVRLDDVSFIDMSGLGILVGARSAQKDRGNRLIVTGATPQVRRTFCLGALTELLEPVDSAG